jgi:hypothetical protein
MTPAISRAIALVAALLASLALVAAASAASLPRNETIMTYDRGYGTQVEYYDGSGRTYLWYPGNRRSLPGEVMLQPNDVICFKYGPDTRDALTGAPGDEWSCAVIEQHDRSIVDRVKGDVFGLSSGRVPFVLLHEPTTIAALRAKRRGGNNAPLTVTPAPAVQQPPDRPPSVEPQTCEEVLAKENGSAFDMTVAGFLYYRGDSCVKIDYVKAFELWRRAGNDGAIRTMLKDLRYKAEFGNPRAIAALEKVGP